MKTTTGSTKATTGGKFSHVMNFDLDKSYCSVLNNRQCRTYDEKHVGGTGGNGGTGAQ